ncbi:MAG: hypothetical protein O8C58_01365 [Candidatus Methanoperedens sp.]|nr:hypothetical protein [Candidatus Methanoperedens sp.]
MTKPDVDTLDMEEGKKILEKELESCIEAEYVFSKVTDMNEQKEVTIPVILLKEYLNNKEAYLDVTMHSRWSAITGDMTEREAWMFLNIHFENRGYLKFKFNLFDANVRKWIQTLILANGNAVLCDRNKTTNFDVGLSNIPLDIPMAQMTLTAFFMKAKRNAFGG